MRVTLATIFGGVGEKPQIAAAARGIDVLVATPGRLVELVDRGALKLDRVEVFVLDEADRMLDLGFIRDIRVLLRHLPRQRHSMMFSATMPPAIREIAEAMLTEPVRIAVTPEVVTVERIRQHVCHVPAASKRPVLVSLLGDQALERVIVFCRTKAGANRVAEHLSKAGIGAAAIHGNKSQNAREAALAAFKAGKVRVLVATDLASRGIDAPGVTHVINFELPNEPESYVHRIGRSARAGRDGVAISLCAPDERAYLRDIERLTKVQVEVMTVSGLPEAAEAAPQKPQHAGGPNAPPRATSRLSHDVKAAVGAPARARLRRRPRPPPPSVPRSRASPSVRPRLPARVRPATSPGPAGAAARAEADARQAAMSSTTRPSTSPRRSRAITSLTPESGATE